MILVSYQKNLNQTSLDTLSLLTKEKYIHDSLVISSLKQESPNSFIIDSVKKKENWAYGPSMCVYLLMKSVYTFTILIIVYTSLNMMPKEKESNSKGKRDKHRV